MLGKYVNTVTNLLKFFLRRLKQSESDKTAAEETARKLGQNLADKDAKR